ncbi:MAG: thioesterase [Gammaproteobacteria bacterium 39-13]|nr:PaaI family thioesterase [Gammaproteobacteria bacterium]OJV85236.1 MAG: thioesterase [Gammaproteobacteria bacterium 39-13]
MLMEQSLQDKYASHNKCFGCGPANDKGLRIKSIVHDNEIIADWQAQPNHEAFPGILNGGIIGTLLDCHSNWSAAYFLMRHLNVDTPPCTVTAYFNVTLKRPTPSDKPVHLIATLKELKEDRALIFASLYSENKVCATCEGLFVAVKEGHPAFHRW